MAGARAFAEEAAARPAKAAKGEPKVSTAPAVPGAASVGPVAASASVAPPIKVCAPSPADLARDAGLSPAELQVLQSLGARRTQIDQRETDLDTQMQLLAAAELKLDTKLKGLNGLKADLQALLTESQTKESAEIDRLVIVYSKMKPRDAAAVMTQLDDKVRIPVAAKMKEAALAAVLSQMPPLEAKKLTESLARRFDKVQQLAQSATAPPAAATPPAATPDPTASPDPTAAAAPAKAAAPKPRRARKAAPKTDTAAAAATKALAAQAAATTAAASAAKPAAPAAATPAPTAAATPAA
jgi:flagellar motility protein MotE (MotC chaperone)